MAFLNFSLEYVTNMQPAKHTITYDVELLKLLQS